MDFTKVFKDIKNTNLINKNCDLVICEDVLSGNEFKFKGGLIGALMTDTEEDKNHYALAFENDVIYLFDVNVKAKVDFARYLGTVVKLPFSDIEQITVSTFFKEIRIRTKQKVHFRIMSRSRIKDYNQKEIVKKVFNNLKSAIKNMK